MIRIRRAEVVDAYAIADIHVRTWRAAYAGVIPSDFLESLSVEKRHEGWSRDLQTGVPTLWVAEVSGQVVGWACADKSRDTDSDPDTSELWAINIDPRYWRHGAGRLLWQEAKGHLASLGFKYVTLWVLANNFQAISFYRALGFMSEAERTIEVGGAKLPEMRFRCAIAG